MEVIEKPIEEELKQSYIDYAMSVIVGRAIPDVRDGLKPVQRRILYTMYEMGLTPEKPFKKCARIVGETLGKYHPHGDQAVYDALVRMAQDFVMRYPLIIGQGNFGSIDGDPPAQLRYTEAKLSKVALEMLRDVDKETVEFVPNFDNTLKEPSVLPTLFPNLLCNGISGIAVGLATSIPPHNLKEVGELLIKLVDNPEMDTEEILKVVKGPDFPTGGVIENFKDLKEVYSKGRGSITVRARYHLERVEGGRKRMVITELPYQVNKSELIKRIASLVKEGKLKGISDLRDESDKEGIRIVIEFKRDVKEEEVVKKLLSLTQLRKNFPVNLVVLINGEPKLVSFKELALEFIKFRLEVILKRSEYYLKRFKERLEVVEGLKVALENLEEVLKVIRGSKDTSLAKEELRKRFSLTQKQADAILDMKLQRLTQMEREKLLKEREELKGKIEELEQVIRSEEKRIEIFKEEMKKLIEEFGDGRRTTLEGETLGGSSVVAVTQEGEIFPLEDLPEGKVLVNILEVSYQEGLFLVSNKGRVYWVAGESALRGSRVSLKEEGEKVVGSFVRERAQKRLLILTKRGMIKKIPLVDFEYKSQGMPIIKLSEGDEVVAISKSLEDHHVLIFTKGGKILRFEVSSVPATSVRSKGVIGVKTEGRDSLVGLRVLGREEELLIITERGKLLKIPSSAVKLKKRAQKMESLKVFDQVVDVIPFKDSLELLILTKEGKAFFDKLKREELRAITKRWQLKGDRIFKVVVKNYGK